MTMEAECHTCWVMGRQPGQLGLTLGLEPSKDSSDHVVLPGRWQPGGMALKSRAEVQMLAVYLEEAKSRGQVLISPGPCSP